MGGAQGYFGVKPDLTVFGKCITGGYPMAGGLGGRRDVMLHLSAGNWRDRRARLCGWHPFGQPVKLCGGLLRPERNGTHQRPGDRRARGRPPVQRFAGNHQPPGLPFVAYNQGSIVHLETSGVMLLDFKNPIKIAREMKPRKHMIEEMGAAYMSQGIITLAGSRMYTSLADTDEVIDEALNGFEKVLSSF